jgi:tripartite-type tricarboxylate transporter receptor subunit TctC
MMKKTLTLVLVSCAVSIFPAVQAQTYPNKTIRMIIPFPPAGGNDIMGRAIATGLSERLGQPVIPDNRPGAGSIIGTEMAARASPDGYTILLGGTASMSINVSLHKKLPYHPLKDFSPITLAGTAPHILVVRPSVPVKTTRDLIELAKAQPGKINLTSTGIGTPAHLAGEIFKSMVGVDMVQIHYKGGAPGYASLLGGETTVCFCGLASARPFLPDGRLNAIAVTSAKRIASLPNLPTIAESGVPGYEVVGWYSIVAPAGTPQAIVDRLNKEIRQVLQGADVKQNFDKLGIEVESSTPEALLAYNRTQIDKWAKAIMAAGITPE